MLSKLSIFLSMFIGLSLSAQTVISGYVGVNEVESAKEIQLYQLDLDDIYNAKKTSKIATAQIDKNGFFKFKKSKISNKDAIYGLHVERFEKALKDTLQIDQLFLFSEGDSIHFRKSEVPFTGYVNTNLADQEWQKLRKFERKLRKTNFKKEDSLSEAYVANLKTYAKDSLEILMVKLIGIKQLDNKELLEKDIVKNPDYYLALLTELKESDIERSEYLFLENKLAFLTTEVAENRYATSKLINLALGLVVVSLMFLVFRLRRSKTKSSSVDLSRQERNIQGLILQGKSNKEIANELFISLSTVKTHITNIYNKLQVSNRQELLRKIQKS